MADKIGFVNFKGATLYDTIQYAANQAAGDQREFLKHISLSPKGYDWGNRQFVSIGASFDKKDRMKISDVDIKIFSSPGSLEDRMGSDTVRKSIEHTGGDSRVSISIYDEPREPRQTDPAYGLSIIGKGLLRGRLFTQHNTADVVEPLSFEEVDKFAELLDIMEVKYKKTDDALVVKAKQREVSLTPDHQVAAYEWAVQNGLDVTMHSWGELGRVHIADDRNRRSETDVYRSHAVCFDICRMFKNITREDIDKTQKVIHETFGIPIIGPWEVDYHSLELPPKAKEAVKKKEKSNVVKIRKAN